ncbi:hypothetical protein IT408_00100 [Candidatus Uhrbacteria bacterium]|nr:hypothetical protein [Candidatus Uhrbacteria bacterium]
MTWLYINSAQPDASDVGIITNATRRITRVTGRSHKILNTISRLKEVKHKKLNGVCVVSGPGSFTSIRTGVLIANVLARLEKIPLVGLHLDQVKDLAEVANGLQNNAFPYRAYVKPEYDTEPNITLPKAKIT